MTHSRPLLCQLGHSFAHVDCQTDGPRGMIVAGNRIVEHDHDAVSEESIQSALVAKDELAKVLLVLAQHPHDLFGLRRLGKGSESTQVAEQRRNLAAVAR